MKNNINEELAEALSNRNKKVITKLLADGADFNAVIGNKEGNDDGDLRTVFSSFFYDYHYYKGGDESIEELLLFIDWLIEKGARLQVPNGLNEMPLYWPIYNRENKLVKALLDRGADLNNWCVNPFGTHTALGALYSSWCSSQKYSKPNWENLSEELEQLFIKSGGKTYLDLCN